MSNPNSSSPKKSSSRKSSASSRKKRKLKRKVDEFSHSVGLSPVKIVLSALLLLGIIAVIGAVLLWPKSDVQTVVVPGELKQRQMELDLDNRLEEMVAQKLKPGANFLAVIERMQQREKELEEIEANNELSESQKVKVDQVRIGNKGITVMMMTRNDVPCDAEKADLEQFCTASIDSPDEALKQSAQFWLCIVPTVDFANSPSAETMGKLTQVLKKHPEGYVTNPDHASYIGGQLLGAKKDAPEARAYWEQGLNVFKEQLALSEIESIRRYDRTCESLKLFGDFNLNTLAYRILWGDPTGP